MPGAFAFHPSARSTTFRTTVSFVFTALRTCRSSVHAHMSMPVHACLCTQVLVVHLVVLLQPTRLRTGTPCGPAKRSCASWPSPRWTAGSSSTLCWRYLSRVLCRGVLCRGVVCPVVSYVACHVVRGSVPRAPRSVSCVLYHVSCVLMLYVVLCCPVAYGRLHVLCGSHAVDVCWCVGV
jgi:hypothetical protein